MKKILLSLTIILILFSCKPKTRNTTADSNSSPVTKSTFLLDTLCNVTLFEPADSSLAEQSIKIISKYDSLLSPEGDNSIIRKINSREKIELDNEITEFFKEIMKLSKDSNGKLDITLGELRDLWKVTSENPVIPEQAQIDAALNNCGMDKIQFEQNTIAVSSGKIDTGAVAKGFIADKIAGFLLEQNVKRAIINLGGNTYTINETNKRRWRVGIRTPFYNDASNIAILETNTESVVTSGIYQRFFEKDGTIYHHIFNPATGYPVQNNLLSVTVADSSSLHADAYATTLFAAGLKEGISTARNKKLSAIFITKNREIHLPETIKDRFTLLNKDFKVNYY